MARNLISGRPQDRLTAPSLKRLGALSILACLCGAMLGGSVPASADSTVITAPGVKIQKRNGWFGSESTSYQDAMGNVVEKRRGLFGRETTRTKVFGNEAIRQGNNVSVTDANGNPLITTRRTLFGGKQTQVDGNSIYQSLKDLFNSAP